MDDWDADDFDPTANVKDKLVELDLGNKNPVQEEEIKKDDKAVNNAKPNRTTKASASHPDRELTEQEKIAAQKKGDKSLAKDLLGLESDEEELSFDSLKNKEDFIQYAESLATKLVAQKSSKHYVEFVAHLVDKLVEPLDSFNRGNADTAIKNKLKALTLKKEEEKPKQQAAKTAPAKKKANKKVYDDYVAGDFDDYEDKYEF